MAARWLQTRVPTLLQHFYSVRRLIEKPIAGRRGSNPPSGTAGSGNARYLFESAPGATAGLATRGRRFLWHVCARLAWEFAWSLLERETEWLARGVTGREHNRELAGGHAVWQLNIDLVGALDQSGSDAGVEELGGLVVHCY